MKKPLALLLVTLALLLPSSFGGQGDNLLKNADFDIDAEGVVADWQVPTYPFSDDPAVAEQLKWGVEDVKGTKCLAISTKEFVKSNLWWEQIVPAIGGNTYEVSVKVKGELMEGSNYGGVQVGVHFLDANGQYLSYQAIPDVKELSDTWQLIKGKITAPDDAVKMGFRMGVNFNGGVKVFFKEPSLTETRK
jgi:hypothetical protein